MLSMLGLKALPLNSTSGGAPDELDTDATAEANRAAPPTGSASREARQCTSLKCRIEMVSAILKVHCSRTPHMPAHVLEVEARIGFTQTRSQRMVGSTPEDNDNNKSPKK
eukprot:RCo035904